MKRGGELATLAGVLAGLDQEVTAARLDCEDAGAAYQASQTAADYARYVQRRMELCDLIHLRRHVERHVGEAAARGRLARSKERR